MAKNKSGRDFLFYANASSPGTASAASSYTLVGLNQTLDIGRSRNAIDVSTKDDGDDSSFIGGRRNQTFTIGGVFDHTEDSGYTVLSDIYESASGLGYFLASSTTTGDTEWYGQGLITDLSLSFPDEGASTYSCTIQVSGALTEATGTTT